MSKLKKASMALLLITFFLLFFALVPIYVNALVINAETASSSADVQVDQIIHTVKIHDYGLVTINDTLKLSPKNASTVSLQNFPIGFPFKYGANLDSCFAYDASNPDERFEVEFDVGLGGRIGFYGVNVVFPEPGVNIGNGESYNLTVVFVFSNLVSYETGILFNLTFPLYPSLTQTASLCNVTVILPPNANHTDSAFREKELDFNVTMLGSRQVVKHSKTSLDDFQYELAWLRFNMTASFPLINVNEVKREVKLDQWGGIHLSDFYHITNKGSRMNNIKVSLPKGAYDVSARDEMGDISASLEKGNANTYPNATINFRTALEKNNAEKFTVTYRLPWKKYVNQHNWRDYNLTFAFFEEFDWTIKKLAVSLTLPEGAEFEPLSVNELVDELVLRGLDSTYSVEKSVFQETVTFSFFNVTPFHDLDFDLTYGYLVFWASFYPTLWMGVLVIVVCAIAFIWRAPKPPPVPIVPVPPGDLRSFVEAYEGKTKIFLELESMEQKLRKGKIPRRRYKVRKKMLEGRLSTLSRDLSSLREKIRAAGGRYANIMRQIEVAETMLEGVETDIRRVEARYRRGEISKGAYRRLLQEYHRRRERAKTTIDEVLLRL
ncbi:MAG: hypothetical protein ACE5J6_04330, partial [Candidatus Bathyarchaeia archaeon]